MKRLLLLRTLLGLLCLSPLMGLAQFECGDPYNYNGHAYETVLIGSQCWFAENLRSENYENGDAIPANLSDSDWSSTSSGALAVFGEGNSECENESSYGDACDDEVWSLNEYGRLYNWYAVDDGRGLCPSGWHIPSDEEFTELTVFLGDYYDVGETLKDDIGWDGINSSGFSALPGGYRSDEGGFYQSGFAGHFWTSTSLESPPWMAWNRQLNNDDDSVSRLGGEKEQGFSVRCVQEAD